MCFLNSDFMLWIVVDDFLLFSLTSLAQLNDSESRDLHDRHTIARGETVQVGLYPSPSEFSKGSPDLPSNFLR